MGFWIAALAAAFVIALWIEWFGRRHAAAEARRTRALLASLPVPEDPADARIAERWREPEF